MYLEHWLYVPLIGPVILLAGFYDRLTPALRNRIAAVAISVLLLLMARTAVRNYDWADAERFYLADMRAVGRSTQMLNNLALHLDSVGKTDRAIEALMLIIETSDTAPEPHDNLAQIYAKRGDYERARGEFLRALEIDPDNRNSMIGLRNLYDARGKFELATKLDQRIRALGRDRGL
jgi:tetratricopeptide (TPR) repeat protein